MKRLTITYGDTPIWDADVDECEIKDTANQITVTGRTKPARNGSGLSGMFGGLAAARKQQELVESVDLASEGK